MATSRPLDRYYDMTFTDPYTSVQISDAAKNDNCQPVEVAGAKRFKFFRKPYIARLKELNPSILLAPTSIGIDPTRKFFSSEFDPPDVRDSCCQTDYRENDTQTDPYSPEYRVLNGDDPEILMLAGLKSGQGLPVEAKEISMIYQARIKRKLERNLPPFTDEAHLTFRKRLLENQELREFNIREKEIDDNHEVRLQQTKDYLERRSNEANFKTEQRIEFIRRKCLDDKQELVEIIDERRLKNMRRILRAKKDTLLDADVCTNPLSSTLCKPKMDIISNYSDKSSEKWGPLRRVGRIRRQVEPGTRVPVLMHLSKTLAPIKLSMTNHGSSSPVKKVNNTSASNRLSESNRVDNNKDKDFNWSTKLDARQRSSHEAVLVQMSSLLVSQYKKKKTMAQGRSESGQVQSSSSASVASSASSATMATFSNRMRTPVIVSSTPESSVFDCAVVLIQSLLRGICTQSVYNREIQERMALLGEFRQTKVADEDAVEVVMPRREAYDIVTDAIGGMLTCSSIVQTSQSHAASC